MPNQENNLAVDEVDEKKSLRQLISEAKRKKEKEDEQEAEEKKQGGDNNILQEPSKVWLKTAWLSMGTLLAIPFSLLYINLHAFMRFVLPQAFCKLGSEWVPKTMRKFPGSSNVNSGLFLIEAILLAFVDLLVLFLLGAFFVLFIVYIDAISNILETLFYFALDSIKSFFTWDK